MISLFHPYRCYHNAITQCLTGYNWEWYGNPIIDAWARIYNVLDNVVFTPLFNDCEYPLCWGQAKYLNEEINEVCSPHQRQLINFLKDVLGDISKADDARTWNTLWCWMTFNCSLSNPAFEEVDNYESNSTASDFIRHLQFNNDDMQLFLKGQLVWDNEMPVEI